MICQGETYDAALYWLMTTTSRDEALGNRLSVTNGADETTEFVYDAANRLTRVEGIGYTFDNNGNLLATGLLTYTFDAANRLSETTQAGITLYLRYDGLVRSQTRF